MLFGFLSKILGAKVDKKKQMKWNNMDTITTCSFSQLFWKKNVRFTFSSFLLSFSSNPWFSPKSPYKIQLFNSVSNCFWEKYKELIFLASPSEARPRPFNFVFLPRFLIDLLTNNLFEITIIWILNWFFVKAFLITWNLRLSVWFS